VGKALVIAAIVVGAALVIAVLVYVAHRSIQGPAARRRELTHQRRVNSELEATIRTIESEADKWSDIDSVLATAIKRELHEMKVRRQTLEDKK